MNFARSSTGVSLDAIADAYRYVETGQKTGIVVINICRHAACHDLRCGSDSTWRRRRHHEIQYIDPCRYVRGNGGRP